MSAQARISLRSSGLIATGYLSGLSGRQGIRARRTQTIQKSFVKIIRRLDLRRVAEVGKLDKMGVRDDGCRGLTEDRIIAQGCANGGRREVLADRCRVLVADHQQHRHREIFEFVEHRLGVDHVVKQC
jgi:hypothetical protein